MSHSYKKGEIVSIARTVFGEKHISLVRFESITENAGAKFICGTEVDRNGTDLNGFMMKLDENVYEITGYEITEKRGSQSVH